MLAESEMLIVLVLFNLIYNERELIERALGLDAKILEDESDFPKNFVLPWLEIVALNRYGALLDALNVIFSLIEDLNVPTDKIIDSARAIFTTELKLEF